MTIATVSVPAGQNRRSFDLTIDPEAMAYGLSRLHHSDPVVITVGHVDVALGV